MGICINNLTEIWVPENAVLDNDLGWRMDNQEKTQPKAKKEVLDILDYQQSLREVRENISRLGKRSIFVVSADQYVRELIKGYFATLEIPADHYRISGSSTIFLSSLKQNPDAVDLLICHLRTADSSISSPTGLQLMQMTKDILLNSGSQKNIPVLIMEKEFDKKDIVSAIKAGASSVLLLPASPLMLGNKIVNSLGKPPSSSTNADEVYALLLLGNKLRGQGLFDQAIGAYNKALAMGGEKVDILNEKANAYLMMGDLESAITAFKRVTEIEANFPRAYQGLGDAYGQLGNFQEAKKNYLKVIEFEPQNVLVYHSAGSLCQEEEDFAAARSFFLKGIELNPKFAKNHLALAKNYELEGKPNEALKVYQNAIAQNPTLSILHINAGEFCLKHEMNVQAEEIFGKAIGLNEEHLHLYNRLGLALRKQGKYDQAIANYAKGIKINGTDANLRYNMAKALYMKGDEEKALEMILSAIKLDPGLKNALEADQEMSKLFEKYPGKFADL